MNPKKNRQRGKDTEKAIAKLLNGRRIGVLGKEDIQKDNLSIEVKHRKAFVGSKWLTQAIKNCKDGKIPVVIVHTHNSRHDNDCVIMRLKDWKELIKGS
ncbi:MAG: hypothetical protein ACE5IH_09070 [Thermodesulfobacteriota bacterium]